MKINRGKLEALVLTTMTNSTCEHLSWEVFDALNVAGNSYPVSKSHSMGYGSELLVYFKVNRMRGTGYLFYKGFTYV